MGCLSMRRLSGANSLGDFTVKKQRTAVLASIALVGGAALTAFAPVAAQAATFNPCSAANHGRLKYSTGSAKHVVFAISSAYSSNHVVVTECVKQGKSW